MRSLREGFEIYELIRLTGHDYDFGCPAKIGVVTAGDGSAVLIGSVSDKNAGKM